MESSIVGTLALFFNIHMVTASCISFTFCDSQKPAVQAEPVILAVATGLRWTLEAVAQHTHSRLCCAVWLDSLCLSLLSLWSGSHTIVMDSKSKLLNFFLRKLLNVQIFEWTKSSTTRTNCHRLLPFGTLQFFWCGHTCRPHASCSRTVACSRRWSGITLILLFVIS